jgi:hypothetical protein
MNLVTQPNLDAPDDFYEALIDAHRGLETPQSHALNARLVLLLANHIGKLEVLREALDAARAASVPDSAARAASVPDSAARAASTSDTTTAPRSPA